MTTAGLGFGAHLMTVWSALLAPSFWESVEGSWREADGLLAEVVVQLGQELPGQVLRIVLGSPLMAPVIPHKFLLSHLLLNLHAGFPSSFSAHTKAVSLHRCGPQVANGVICEGPAAVKRAS